MPRSKKKKILLINIQILFRIYLKIKNARKVLSIKTLIFFVLRQIWTIRDKLLILFSFYLHLINQYTMSICF